MKHLAILTFFASALAYGQDQPRLNARELFYSAPAAANPPATPTTAAASKSGDAKSTPGATASNANKKQTTAKNTTSGGRQPSSGGTTGTVVTPVSGTSNSNSSPSVADGNQHIIAASSTTGPLGLRYSVMKRDPTGGYREVDPDTTFKTGDAIRLQVEANSNGYLYVVTQGTSGQWQLLFPRPEVSGGSNRVEPHSKIDVPGNQGVWKFDEHAGTEKLFLVLARQPEPDLDKLIYAIGGAGGGNAAPHDTLVAQASIRDDVVSRMRNTMLSRDLVFEKVGEETTDTTVVKNENAAYVVTVSTAPDARVVKDFALQHK